MMNPNISMSLDRADELLVELRSEYDQSLHARTVSARAVHYTHEVCERLRSVLDRLARAYWETHIAPALSTEDREKALVYFPIADDQNSFDSVMGRWRWKSVAGQHGGLRQYVLGLQPFSDAGNSWLALLNKLALQSKHIDLVPQKRIEERRVSVTRSAAGASVSWGKSGLIIGEGGGISIEPGGSISFGPGGVQFGGDVRALGAPIDPRTQRIVPTAGVTEKVEVWVSFLIEEHDVNALTFCVDAARNVRGIAEHMTRAFNL